MLDLSCFNWVQLIKKSDLPSNAKFIGLYLSTFMNAEHNIAWPSMKRISQETGLSMPTTRKWLDYLDENDWLIKRSNAREIITPGGPQRQNEYLIAIPESVLREVNSLLPLAKGGQTVDQRGVNESSKGGKQFSPNNNRITTNNNNKERGGFSPPSLDEVTQYCKQRNNTVNPKAFVAFYESKGWMVGKSKMKSWEASVRTWEQRDESKTKPSGKLARAVEAIKVHHAETNTDRTTTQDAGKTTGLLTGSGRTPPGD